jgi:hypothetical protein
MLPGDHSNPQPKCGNKCPDENYTSTDLEGAPIYLTVGTGGEGAYPNPDFHWANNHERLNAYAAAFATTQQRQSGAALVIQAELQPADHPSYLFTARAGPEGVMEISQG